MAFKIQVESEGEISSKLTALRIANTVTGGYMPTDDPLFDKMVKKARAGDIQGAAAVAADSDYFTNYLARRLALQMQNPALSASNGMDNDSTAFIIAHFVGTPKSLPSISTLFSENATYLVSVASQNMHAADLTPGQLSSLNWASALTQNMGQADVNGTAIPQKHVGGFVTLSDRPNDNSFAMFGATAGTNLRMIEGIWEIGTGLQLTDVASTEASPQEVARFVPEINPNFYHGQGQAACISCHGGGMGSLGHGYSTVADVFDFNPDSGFTFTLPSIEASSGAAKFAQMKSLGSNPDDRATNAACDMTATPTPVCNPLSRGADPNQAWDVAVTWGTSGVLGTMGWKGPTSGQGLNSLGAAIGQSAIVYQFLTKRVIGEICPMGQFTDDDVSKIAAAANPFATPAGSDDIRTIVVMVASNGSCQ
jgi:hypothetical protein